MAEKSAHVLVLAVVGLISLGMVMLLSTSSFVTDRADVFYDVRRQVAWLLIGVSACVLMASVDYHWWGRTAWWWFAGACLLLGLCYVPGIGMRVNGSARWIGGKSFGLPGMTVQPSEFAKLAVLFLLARWLTVHKAESSTFLRGFLYPLLLAGIPIGLIAFEIDIGTAALISTMAVAVVFIAGARIKFIAAAALTTLGAVGLAIYHHPNRLERFIAFMDLEKHKLGLGQQQFRAQLAFGEGGLWGMGIGEGREKLMYMSYAHTDFIFPMVGEELGLVGSMAVVFTYVLIAVFGILIATQAPDRFGKLLGFGVVGMICLQAAINIGVTTAVLPNKGLPLPFVSYGGSNLLVCLIGVGLLLNIYRQGQEPSEEAYPRILKRKITPRV
ncbi:MAG: cell division protein FtsW [Pseudoalteromonas tetraodonis]|jgi:cell division protein FtsW